jgi:hypothetical protein
MSVEERLDRPGPKRLLALDGGGVRSVITIEVLAEIERLAREAEGRGDDFVLADFFDYIGGTSTGAILAACLSMGMSVGRLRELFHSLAPSMFERAFILHRLRHMYSPDPLAARLREIFGAEITLGSEKLRTLLLLVATNAATNTTLPLTNNPRAKFNDPDRPDSNLKMPLWKVLRGSTAAPTYFPPELIEVGGRSVLLSDGGVSAYNNPSLLLLLMATLEPYRVGWHADEKELLLVSVGAGTRSTLSEETADVEAPQPGVANMLENAVIIPSALMQSAAAEQDILCRVLGNCLAGEPLDRELGNLFGVSGLTEKKLFTYLRYNVELTGAGLFGLGISSVNPEQVQRFDSVEHIAELQLIGRTLARSRVRPEHFEGFLGGEGPPGAPKRQGVVRSAESARPRPPQKLDVRIRQGEKFEREDWWEWWVWVEGADEELDKIDRVIYLLDRTFPNPIREVTDRESKFRLNSGGWGVFPIIATVVRKDGGKETLVHNLVLTYPDGTLNTR